MASIRIPTSSFLSGAHCHSYATLSKTDGGLATEWILLPVHFTLSWSKFDVPFIKFVCLLVLSLVKRIKSLEDVNQDRSCNHLQHLKARRKSENLHTICIFEMKKLQSCLQLAVLFPSATHSHYHLQGQGGGGGAPRGEGGHHHLRVDGVLSLLRVHAQYGHLRQGQMAGMMALLVA